MKKSMKRIVAMVLTVALFSCMGCAFAAMRSSAYLDSYGAAVYANSGAKIIVNVDVDGAGYMTKLGATSVTIYESTDNVDFDPVRTYYDEDYPELMGSGLHFNEDVITYQGTAGRYYCAAVYFYAEDSTGSDSRFYMTSSVRAIS